MSRAALWRQEGNMKERERRAEELFQTACEEGRSRSKSTLPLWGPDESFHWNPVLLRNTIQSPYFQKCVTEFKDWNAVIDEIYYQVQHLQPFSIPSNPTSPPSTAFCLLLRLLTLRMTEHQLNLTLKHPDSPCIRAIGFLYLRYVGQPAQVWDHIQPYLYDEQEVQVEAAGSGAFAKKQATATTMGDFIRSLFRNRDYHGTPLPRLPLQVERDLQVQVLHAERVVERAEMHLASNHYPSNSSKGETGLFRVGSHVMALYGDEENPIRWYTALVDRVITKDEEGGFALKFPRFVVTFTEYGNTETVHLGEMDIIDGNWKQDNKSIPQHGGRGINRGYDQEHDQLSRNDNLYEEVRRRERETVTAEKGQWARRPPTTKDSLSSASAGAGSGSGAGLKGGGHRGSGRRQERGYNNSSHNSRQQHNKQDRRRGDFSKNASDMSNEHGDCDNSHESSSHQEQQQLQPPQPGRKRTAEEMAAIAEKKRRLLAKYG